MNVLDLTRKGFVSVEYPPALRHCVDEAMELWKDFCNLPEEQKMKFSNHSRLHDFGYMLRNDDKELRADRKELFHVVQNRVPALRKCAQGIAGKCPLTFIDTIDRLITESATLISPFAQAVEKQYGLNGFEKEVMNAQSNWTFRYLHYFGSTILAHPHADRGDFTLHLSETSGGGECYGLNKKWKPWPVSKDATIIFPGMGLQYRSSNELKALWHQVLPETKKQEERFAMVCFVDFEQDYRYNDAAGRLRDFNPGFNYDMPFDKFKELFVPRT